MVPGALRFEPPEQPATEAAVAAFEGRIGARLPADYRAFLLEHNGGRPADDLYLTPDGLAVDRFYSLGKEDLDSVDDLEWNRRIAGLSSAFLPIAGDRSGNALALSVIEGDRGTVYFWDHYADELTRLARSFSSLLDDRLTI